ncbi:hypothetical protein BST61_g156 [Cercospora zeina]
MDKLKKVFSPGADKDDAILYGSEEARLKNTSDNGTSGQDNTTTAAGQTDGLADNRTGTQAAQDQSGAHGPGRDAGEANVVSREHDNDPDKGKTILAATGTTPQSRPLGESGSSGLGGQTSSLRDGTSTGVAAQNPTASSNYQTTSTRSGGITDSADTTFSTGQLTTDSSDFGRNAGIAGGLAAAGAGGAAYAGSRHNDNTNALSSTDTAQHVGERSHPTTSGAGHGHINPIAAPEANLRETTSQSARDSQLGSSHAGVLRSSEPSSSIPAGGIRNDEGVTQLNKAPADVQGATFLDRSYYIGKSGDAVDHGPNVAGQFPPAQSATSDPPLPATTAAGAGVGAIGAGSVLGGQSSSPALDTSASPGIQTTTNTTQRVSASARHGSISSVDHNPDSSSSHHSGRDAAIVGGAGVAGVAGAGAAYAATRESDPTTHGAYGAEDPNVHNKLHKSSPDEKKLEKEHAKEEKQHQKEVEKQQRELEKEQEKKQRELKKEQEKKQRELEKQQEKDEKERRHAAEKAEKKHEKELEKEEKEKKPGLISRILHRNKDDKDGETKEATELRENKDNGPLDHPLITAAGTTTAAGTAGAAGAYTSHDSAAGERGNVTGQRPHGETRGATELGENKDNGPLDHPLITAAGATTAVGAAGAAGTYASRDSAPGESGNLTGQRQHDVEPALSGNNNTIGGPGAVSTTSNQPATNLPTQGTTITSSPTGAQYAAASGGALGAAAGAGALVSSSGATSERETGLTGQRQHDVEPLLSGENNAIGGSGTTNTTTTTTTTTSSVQPQVSSNQYSSKFSENTELGGAGAAAAAPVVIIPGSTTTGDSSLVGNTTSSSSGTRNEDKAAVGHVPGEGLTGRRQDDVDPYISGGGFTTSSKGLWG